MRSKRAREGYLIIDERAAGVKGPPKEAATVTCAHCQAIVIINPLRTRQRNWCWNCDHYICDKPECRIECNPMKRRFEQAHNQAVKLTPGGIILP